jgi:acetyltransferase-like isoleucine patch superfamily enzyme
MEPRFTARTGQTSFDIADRVEFGRDVVFGPACRTVRIGFGSTIGDDVYLDAPEIGIGDYCKLHRGCLLHGYRPLTIGHNCWVGQHSIIDSIGGATIGSNVGIGAQSQLWSHIKFGDTLAGCRWNADRPLVVEDDVWFVGHCIVSPIRARRRSMLLVGGVATRDMDENRVYAGAPAKDITDRVGPQFANVTPDQVAGRFADLVAQFRRETGVTETAFRVTVADDLAGRASSPGETIVCLRERTYLPARSEPEYRLMKFLLYDRAKFVPAGG